MEKHTKLVIIIASIVLFAVVFACFLPKRRKSDNYDNFFGELADDFVQDPEVKKYPKFKFPPKLLLDGAPIPTKQTDGGECVNKDYLKVNLNNCGIYPITIGLNTMDSELDNQSIAQYLLDNLAGDSGISASGIMYSSQGAGLNTVVAVNSQNGQTTTITLQGSNLPPFNSGTGFNSTVNVIALRSDGYIVAGGLFTAYNSLTNNRIIVLESGGSKDLLFDNTTGFNGVVLPNSIVVQSDDKIVVGGSFTTYKGVTQNSIVRLNTNGSADSSFITGTGFDAQVDCLAIQSDGKILAGTGGSTYNGTPFSGLFIRLNADGTIDSSFIIGTGFNANPSVICIQPLNGKILVGGSFTDYNGNTANSIARINTDGSFDSSFVTGTGFDAVVDCIAVQADGKILVGGFFTNYNGTATNRIVRLNADGTIDSSFIIGTGFNARVLTLYVQSDGKILAGGAFTSYNGTTSNRIVRLESTGAIDATFNVGTGFDLQVRSIKVASNNKVIAGGDFTTYKGISNNSIIKLDSDGAIDTGSITQTSQYGAFSSVTQSYYQVIGTSIARIDANPYSPTYNTVVATFAAGTTPLNLSIGADGNILVGNGDGAFGYMNGTTGAYIVALTTVGGAGNVVTKAFLDANGYLTFGYGTTNIVRFNSLDHTYSQINVGVVNSAPYYVWPQENLLFYFTNSNNTINRYDLALSAITGSLVLPTTSTVNSVQGWRRQLVIAGSVIMMVDPITMVVNSTINFSSTGGSFTAASLVISCSNYLYALGLNSTMMQIIDLNPETPYALSSGNISMGGMGGTVYLSSGQTVIASTLSNTGTDNIVKVPVISNETKAKFLYTNYNNFKVCGIRYQCRTDAQLGNPLIFPVNDVTGMKSEYKITLIDRKSMNQIQNIIWILDLDLTLYNNQSIVHTINPGEEIVIYFYMADAVSRIKALDGGSLSDTHDSSSDIGSGWLSLESPKPVDEDESEPSIEEIENDFRFEEIEIELASSEAELGDA